MGVSTRQQLVFEDCERVSGEVVRALDALENSSLLITGGTGFMGSWVSEMVYCLNEAHRKNIKLYLLARDRDRFAERLPHIAAKPWAEFIRCDVRSLMDMPKDVHYVLHAAGTPDNRFHSSNPFETMTTISEGTSSVLRSANRLSDLRKVVNVSSSSVYGAQPEGKIAETASGLPLSSGIKSPYAEAKRYAEALCAASRSESRMPVVSVRPFTFIGPYQELDSPWAVNNFLNDALHKRPIRILGDGLTVRSYMYGADLAAWLLVIMVSAKSGQTYNVGSDTGFFLKDIAEKVSTHFQPVPDVILNASLTGAAPNSRLVPDTSAAAADFKLRTYTGIDESIRRTVLWHQAK